MLYPVDLDITDLSETMQNKYCPIPFILRRSFPEAHKLALSKFASILEMPSRAQRRQWISSVADGYAKRHNALLKDWITCMPLIFKCALLPPGSEFRHHSIDGDCFLYPEIAQKIQGSSSRTLHQREILEHILLPEAGGAIASSNPSRLHLVLDIALTVLGALDSRDSPPCPAMECFIISILWRLGCLQEIEAFLASRSRHCPSSSQNPMDDFFGRNRRVVSNSTNIFISTLLVLSTEVRFGQSSCRFQASGYMAKGRQYGKFSVVMDIICS